jgi:hypothetical protein
MMMTDPITPPPELVDKLFMLDTSEEGRLIAAYRAGADQELEATLGLMATLNIRGVDYVRNARRPKPPSLKRVALLQLDTLNADLGLEGKGVDLSQIRSALEALDD